MPPSRPPVGTSLDGVASPEQVTRRPADTNLRRCAARTAVALMLFAPALEGCAPASRAVSPAAAARIRAACPPDTFIGTMTADCPVSRPAAPAG